MRICANSNFKQAFGSIIITNKSKPWPNNRRLLQVYQSRLRLGTILQLLSPGKWLIRYEKKQNARHLCQAFPGMYAKQQQQQQTINPIAIFYFNTNQNDHISHTLKYRSADTVRKTALQENYIACLQSARKNHPI